MGIPEKITIKWTEYVKYRAKLRSYKIALIEHIVRYSEERYFDTVTQRMIVIGKHENRLVLVSYEKEENDIISVTIHAASCQQVNFRLKTGRFIYETYYTRSVLNLGVSKHLIFC